MKLDLDRQGPGRTHLDVGADVSLQWGEERPGEAHVVGRLQVDNLGGRFLVGGTLAACATGECSRCLEPCEVRWEAPVDCMVVRDLDSDEADGDSMVILQQSGEVDLREVIRECLLLAYPQAPLCGDSCRGLCPQCGADLNAGPCGCPQEASDPRWADLP